MTARRLAVILAGAALLATGCDALREQLPDPDVPQSPDATADPSEPGDSDSTDGPDVALDDRAGVGAHGPAMLREAPSSLVVEIDVQEGAPTPTEAALAHLRSTLQAVTAKGEVEVRVDESFASDRTQWTTVDLREAADQHRDTSSGGDIVSMYLLYVRGGLVADGQETNALGVAHTASEAGIFPERWRGLGSVIDNGVAVERAVLVHELGHLLGLVNLTYTSDHDHEDPAHPGHSSERDSVMFHAVETTLIGQAFDGPPPDGFTAVDRDDLEGLRTGRY